MLRSTIIIVAHVAEGGVTSVRHHSGSSMNLRIKAALHAVWRKMSCGLAKDVIRNYAAEINEQEIVSIVREAGIEGILGKGDQGCPLHVSLYGHDAPVWN